MPLQIFNNQGNPLENINVNVSNQSQLLNNQNQVINPATLESIQELNSLLSEIKTDIDTKIILSNTNDVRITNSVLPNGAATDSTLISGNAKFRIFDSNGNSISSTEGALDVNIKSGMGISVNLNATNDSVLVYGYDQANGNYKPIKVNQDGLILINKDGLATSEKQDISNTYLSEIDNKVATENTLLQINNKLSSDEYKNLNVKISNSNLDVSVTSSVLPSGAATSANQTQIYNILNDKLDVNLSSRASESTLSEVNSNIVSVKNSIDTANTDIVNAITFKATENTLQTVNSNVAALSPKLDEVKTSIVNQLDWRVRGLFDNDGNPISSALLSILNKRGIFNIGSILGQYLAFNKQMFYYTYQVSVNTGDTYLLALINPPNSGKIFLINRIAVVRIYSSTNNVGIRVNINAVINSGTQRLPLSTISGGTSSSILYTSPTITNIGNLMFVLVDNTYTANMEKQLNLEFGLNPGENLLIMGNASAVTPCYITIEWAEV
jgi:hypothetical protein